MAASRPIRAFSVRSIATGLPCALLLTGACTNDYSALDVSGEHETDTGGNNGAGGGTGVGGRFTGGASNAGGTSAGGTAQAGAGGGAGAGGAPSLDGGLGAGGETAPGSGGAGPGEAGTGGSTADAGPPSCTDLYGTAAGFTLCDETPTSCMVAVRTGGGNCDTLCQSLGGTCLSAIDNITDTEPCTPRPVADTCGSNRMSTICTCSRS